MSHLPNRPSPAVALALSALALVSLVACSTSDDPAGAGPARDSTVITHARGKTTVPADPQRVVVLEPVQLDTSVALGVIPVGAAVLDEKAGIPSYLGEAARDIELVGTVPEPDLERIAALRPDLILGTEARHSALFDKLDAIAPTVFMESQSDPWQDNVDLVAQALGDVNGAGKLLEDYETKCDEVAAKHDTDGKTAQLIRPRDGIFTLYGPTSFAGSTLECAGFTTPPRNWGTEISIDVSAERVVDTSADLILATTTDVDDPNTIPPLLRSDAFPTMQAVDQAFWITGVGPLGGITVLDDLDRILTSVS